MPLPNHTHTELAKPRIPWFPLEVLAVVLTGFATCLLAWMEFDRHEYEKNKLSLDSMWRLEEFSNVVKNWPACGRFVLKLNEEKHWEAVLGAQEFTVEGLDQHDLRLFERCVSSNTEKKSHSEDMGGDKIKLKIHETDLFELRRQILGTLNAYDFALMPYRTGLGNKKLICENMAAVFWRRSKPGTERADTATKKFVDHIFKWIPEAHYSFPSLFEFLRDVKHGSCV